ncbi:MAG TPA: hypothetical protein VIW03_18300 [Anaeromyxobacter sp.]
MRLRPEHPREILHELPWLALAMIGLVAMLALEHYLVYKQIVLPALQITAEPPLWMWGAMFVPELVVFFAAGWRLRSWSDVGGYAIVGATVREGVHYVLARAGEPGHIDALRDPFSDFVVNWPAIALAYALVLGLAAWSGRQEGHLAVGT